jgi:hypothetical protein
MGQTLSFERQSYSRSRPLREVQATGLTAALSGAIIHRCSEQFVRNCREVEPIKGSDSKDSSEGEKAQGHSPRSESWWSNTSSLASDSDSFCGSLCLADLVALEHGLAASGSGLSSEGAAVVSSHGKDSQAGSGTNGILRLGGGSVGLPLTHVIEFADEQRAIVTGPYSEDVFEILQNAFDNAKVEYWGQRFRIQMPSSPISKKDPVTHLIERWESRLPSRHGLLQSFQSSALFNLPGSIASAGERIRLVPDISVTTTARYNQEYSASTPNFRKVSYQRPA